ncbi:MAG: hypothetical protein H7Y22_10965 [Gemmatimonadaceae bacterium]|nr:hypothetical protein [Gloeobacterales cyanobacterium ES-bin-141]
MFSSPNSNVLQVLFFLDDPDMSGPPRKTENVKPYDFAGGTSSTANPFDTATVVDGSHTITAKIILLDGATQVLNATFDVDNISELDTYTWSTAAPSPISRFEAQGVTVDDRLYVFGGFINSSLEATSRSDVYDSSTDSWTQIADMPEPLTHSAVVVDGQTIYLVGGYVGDHPGPSTPNVWKYSIPTNSWSAAPSLPVTRGAGAAARLGRNLHFFGGATRSAGQTDEVDRGEHYKLSLDGGTTWSGLAPLPNPRNHLGAATNGVVLYAVGGQHGRDEQSGNQDQVDIYDPSANDWTRAAELPAPRGHISSSTFLKDGYIFAIGGTLNGNQPSADVTAYDPVSASWVVLPSLPQARKSPVAGPIGEKIFSSTGNAKSGAAPTKTTYRGTPASTEVSAPEPDDR